MTKRILIVESNKSYLKEITTILEDNNYAVIPQEDALTVRAAIMINNPHLIIMDTDLAGMNGFGFDLCERIIKDPKIEQIPVIIVSDSQDSDSVEKAFNAGAVDFIKKPCNTSEILARISMHIKYQEMQALLLEKNQSLETQVIAQDKKITEMQMETIFSIAKLAQSRDDDTGKHLERVQKYCYSLSVELAKNSPYSSRIDKNFIKNIVFASTLHDIGKVGIPDSILLKPGKLTPEEFDIMKLHTVYGAETLEEVHKKFGKNEFLKMGIDISKYHHERWDGKGYPEGLKDDDIPLCARIMAIADVYDALSTKRVYKPAFPHEKCVEIIKEGSGTQFDPHVVNAFLNVDAEFATIKYIATDKVTV